MRRGRDGLKLTIQWEGPCLGLEQMKEGASLRVETVTAVIKWCNAGAVPGYLQPVELDLIRPQPRSYMASGGGRPYRPVEERPSRRGDCLPERPLRVDSLSWCDCGSTAHARVAQSTRRRRDSLRAMSRGDHGPQAAATYIIWLTNAGGGGIHGHGASPGGGCAQLQTGCVSGQ